jgi:hypothetical protein
MRWWIAFATCMSLLSGCGDRHDTDLAPPATATTNPTPVPRQQVTQHPQAPFPYAAPADVGQTIPSTHSGAAASGCFGYPLANRHPD